MNTDQPAAVYIRAVAWGADVVNSCSWWYVSVVKGRLLTWGISHHFKTKIGS